MMIGLNVLQKLFKIMLNVNFLWTNLWPVKQIFQKDLHWHPYKINRKLNKVIFHLLVEHWLLSVPEVDVKHSLCGCVFWMSLDLWFEIIRFLFCPLFNSTSSLLYCKWKSKLYVSSSVHFLTQGRTAVEIYIDKKWIKSGTLGEYEVSGGMFNHILSELTTFALECITSVS